MRRYGFFLSILFLVSLLAAMSGCVISPRRIVGGSTSPTPTPSGSPTPTPTPTPTPNPAVTGKLYVSNQGGNSILRFDNAFTANGNIQPNATIVGTATTLNGPQFMTLDVANDRLFVANANNSTILIWDAISTKTGNAPPSRTLGGATSGLLTPSDVALDKAHDLLYVADGNDIFVFSQASTINGDQPAGRDILMSVSAQGILLDTANDRLYVSDGATNSINVFDAVSTLNSPTTPVAPSRSIVGANTGLSGPTGMTFDASGNLVVANQGNKSITVYSNPGALNGNATPIVTLSGTNTTLQSPGQIIRNTASATNEIFVADALANDVAMFTLTSQTGNTAPSRKIAGPATTLTGVSARGIALDPTR